jgi:hypothetical protein
MLRFLRWLHDAGSVVAVVGYSALVVLVCGGGILLCAYRLIT